MVPTSIASLPYEFQPHETHTNYLNALIERELKKIAPEDTTVAPLVSGLAQRLQKREAEINAARDAQSWMPGAREAKKDPLEYMELCRTYLAKMDTQGWNRSYHQ